MDPERKLMREIVLDTETTGLHHGGDDRIVEIGCVELLNHMATGETFHCYINPERDVPDGAFKVHGLSQDFLSDHPVFAKTADEFLAFIGDSKLIIHNAEFDMGFINAELGRLQMTQLPDDRAVDTLKIARRKFPGSPANLDALCRRFDIDISDRELHGALKDARLLADVYLELIGGRQPALELAAAELAAAGASPKISDSQTPTEGQSQLAPRPHGVAEGEEAAHKKFLEKIKAPIWNQ